VPLGAHGLFYERKKRTANPPPTVFGRYAYQSDVGDLRPKVFEAQIPGQAAVELGDDHLPPFNLAPHDFRGKVLALTHEIDVGRDGEAGREISARHARFILSFKAAA
jgi:hypothetical protein